MRYSGRKSKPESSGIFGLILLLMLHGILTVKDAKIKWYEVLILFMVVLIFVNIIWFIVGLF